MYNLFFILSGILWSLELYPQLYKTYKTKRTGDISLFYYVMCICAYILFLIGAILMRNWYLLCSHILPFINLIILVILIIKYRKRNTVCKYWIELDDINGMYEYCKKINHQVICCADKRKCVVRTIRR